MRGSPPAHGRLNSVYFLNLATVTQFIWYLSNIPELTGTENRTRTGRFILFCGEIFDFEDIGLCSEYLGAPKAALVLGALYDIRKKWALRFYV